MAKPNSSKTKWIWLSVLVLFVCVAATAIAFFSRLDMFLLNDTGAIPLITDPTGTDDGSDETGDPQETTAPQAPTGGSGDPSGAGQNDSGSTEDAPQSTGQTFSPFGPPTPKWRSSGSLTKTGSRSSLWTALTVTSSSPPARKTPTPLN